MIAVDGKTLRGSATADGPGRHLLAALDHDYGVVLGQADVEAKTNEIPMFATMPARIGLAGAVVTADALHGHAVRCRQTPRGDPAPPLAQEDLRSPAGARPARAEEQAAPGACGAAAAPGGPA